MVVVVVSPNPQGTGPAPQAVRKQLGLTPARARMMVVNPQGTGPAPQAVYNHS
jgi:hypothetical protein